RIFSTLGPAGHRLNPETGPVLLLGRPQGLLAPQSVSFSRIAAERASFRLATGPDPAIGNSPIAGPTALRTAKQRTISDVIVDKKFGTSSGTTATTSTGSAMNGGKNIRTLIGDSIRERTGGGGARGVLCPLGCPGDGASRPI